MKPKIRIKGSAASRGPSGFVRRARAYEAANSQRRLSGWFSSAGSPDAEIAGSLATLRGRARELGRNNPLGARVLDVIQSNTVGTGLTPHPQSPDPQFNKDAMALWEQWNGVADVTGALPFYGMQSLAMRSCAEAGEGLARLRPRRLSDGLPVPLQIQLLEPDHLDESYDAELGAGRLIRQGVEFDPIGRPDAYHLFRNHPGDWRPGSLERVRVPAGEVLHIREIRRIGQTRGVPWFVSVMVRLKDIDEYDDAEIIRKKTAAMFAGFIKRTGGGAAVDPLTGGLIEKDGDEEIGIAALEPGTLQVLEPDEDLVFSGPVDVGGSYGEFTTQQLRRVAVGARVLYEQLTGDYSKGNDRLYRAALNEFKRFCRQWQQFVVAHQFSTPVWRAFVRSAIASGALDAPGFAASPEAFLAVKWRAEPWEYLHPVQDVQAREREVSAGFRSRPHVIIERGLDPERVDLENAEANERAAELGLVYSTSTDGSATAQAEPDVTEDVGVEDQEQGDGDAEPSGN